jgi:hypothetical protein
MNDKELVAKTMQKDATSDRHQKHGETKGKRAHSPDIFEPYKQRMIDRLKRAGSTRKVGLAEIFNDVDLNRFDI